MTATANRATRAVPTAPAALHAAIAGVLAAAAALGVAELVAGLLGGPSLLIAVGDAVIALQPPGAKDLVVSLFGTSDKAALQLTIAAASLAIGAGLGIAARRHLQAATAGYAAAGVVGAVAALADPQASAVLAIGEAGLAVVVAVRVLRALLDVGAGAGAAATSKSRATATSPDRRSFLVRAGAVGIGSVAASAFGRFLLARTASLPTTVTYPRPSAVATLPPGAELPVAGITPLVVPNDDFYRIDTALLVPRVDPATWQLRIHGLVERETTLSFADLTALPTFEQYVTIACVSNEVGGGLVGNAKWTGVRLREVLAMAGVRPEASQLVGRSVDGWTAGMPTAWVMDPAREPMIALQMNDEPLPVAHGFPARLIVPGLYGYVSATKWLSELELTTLEAFDAYWVPLGWAKEGPILTQSRIDVPANGASVQAGRVAIAGVAWAPDRGVARVEVAVDGQWRDAQLSMPISDATWVQWRIAWDATPGRHELRVRATDGTGQVQDPNRTPPAPSGARGEHTIVVSVRG